MDKVLYVDKQFERHLAEFKKHFPKLELVYMAIQGSQNYDLDEYNDYYHSDIDTKAIVLPSLDDIILNKEPISKTFVLDNNEHIDIKDIRIMFECFKKQNINFIEILFSRYCYINPKYEQFFIPLLEHREEIARLNYNQALRCMSGMSMQKLAALCHPYPTIKDKIDKYGYDGKQLHHIIRMNDFIKNYVANKSYKECLTSYADKELLWKAKLNMFSLEEAKQLAVKYDEETHKIATNNLLEEDQLDYNAIEILSKCQYNCIRKYLAEELRGEI